MPDEKEHEYELIPLSPLRRLEKRIDEVEKSHINVGNKEFYRELVDIIRMNQQIVDELAKANDALRIEISRLPGKMEELLTKIDELVSYIKASATEEITAPMTAAITGEAATKPLGEKLDVLIDTNKKIVENNESLLTLLDQLSRKLSRPSPYPVRKPTFIPPKTI